MRSDREQFEKITGDYEAHGQKVRARRKMWTIIVSAVLVTALLVSSVIVLPGLFKKNDDTSDLTKNATAAYVDKEGRTVYRAENGSYFYMTDDGGTVSVPTVTPTPLSGGKEYYIDGSGKVVTTLPSVSDPLGGLYASDKLEYVVPGTDSRYSEDVPAPAWDPSGSMYTPAPGDDASYEPYEPYDPSANYQAGQLTGAEIKDRAYYEGYRQDMEKIKDGTSALTKLAALNRIKVTVKNGDTPLSLVRVELCADQMSGAIYTAVTDVWGEAYLFYNVLGGNSDQPSYINVKGAAETKTVSVLKDGAVQSEVSVELNGANAQRRLDLMFMIDTTGSMGDELEYLKAEISDIITRITSNGKYNVRTSVNFYRDEGDQYIVHATPFTTNVDEVLGYIGGERAMGGGDYPEAVHTALDNAVNGHEWDEGAEKLLFVVLDAPPHENADVARSLNATIVAAAAKGIRVIPIVSSGSDSLTEYLMRTYAVLTGGTYTFLTNHSGIGNPHADPNTGFQYEIEMLNAMIVRIAQEYLGEVIPQQPIDLPTVEPVTVYPTTDEIPVPGSIYPITVNDPGEFIIDCPESAKPGTEVEIRTGVVCDADLELVYKTYTDEKETPLVRTHYDSDYWGYTFTMPSQDVIIEVHVVGGFFG